jgi:hypothetical protein
MRVNVPKICATLILVHYCKTVNFIENFSSCRKLPGNIKYSLLDPFHLLKHSFDVVDVWGISRYGCSSQPPMKWVSGILSPGVRRLWREADHSPLSMSEVKNVSGYKSTTQYVSMAWSSGLGVGPGATSPWCGLPAWGLRD